MALFQRPREELPAPEMVTYIEITLTWEFTRREYWPVSDYRVHYTGNGHEARVEIQPTRRGGEPAAVYMPGGCVKVARVKAPAGKYQPGVTY